MGRISNLTALICAALATMTLGARCEPYIGVSLNLPEGSTGKMLVDEIVSLRKQGAQMMYLSYKWSDLEPKPGQINLKDLAGGVSGMTGLGYKVAITIQTLDTTNRTLPPDLAKLPFDSPQMRDRFDILLREIAHKLSPNVLWLSLGNEVDVYLGSHSAELEPYMGFVERGRKTLRAICPKVQVGCTATYGGLQSNPAMVRRINRDMDVVYLTYYPLDGAFNVKPISVIAPDIDAMARAAGAKPMVLQEAGYPADALLGSSEEKQAAFVDALLDAVRKHSAKIGFVNYFLLCDFSDKLVDTFTRYYGLNAPRFRAYLATLGLKRADNTPRKAWYRFQARMKGWPKPVK